MKGAKTIIETCLAVQPGENVLIVTDTEMFRIAEVLMATTFIQRAEALITIMAPRKSHGEEPPQPIAAAMKEADAILVPVTTSITHTHALREAVAAGARAIVMTSFTEDMMISGGIEADFTAQKPICERVAKIFTEAKSAKLTTPKGTFLTMKKDERKGNALTGIVGPGEFSTVPTIEANFSPIEGTTEGMLVADASIPYLGIGILREPVRAKVERGWITDIQGGEEARIIKENLEKYKDPNCYNIAELGVGLNPAARMSGMMLEDEGVLGVVHIGIGTNITLGGKIKAPMHYDLLMWKPSLWLDGNLILKDGILQI